MPGWQFTTVMMPSTMLSASNHRELLGQFMTDAPSSVTPDRVSLSWVLALVQVGQLHGIEQLLDLLFGQDVLFPNDLDNALAALVGLVGKLGRLLVAHHGIEGRHDADRGLHVVRQHLLVDRDTVDALGPERPAGVVEQLL